MTDIGRKQPTVRNSIHILTPAEVRQVIANHMVAQTDHAQFIVTSFRSVNANLKSNF